MNYRVYQGEELKQTVTDKTAVINGLQPNKTYEFSVQADNVQPGPDGKTRYLHTVYADSADGKNGFYVSGRTNLLTGTGNHTLTGADPVTDLGISGYLSNETTDDLLNLFKELEGQTVTVSVDYEYSGFVAGSGRNRLGWEIQIVSDTTSYDGLWYYPTNDSGSGRISSTFVVPKNITGIGYANGYIQFSGSGTGTLSHLKLEKGSVATPWSPAPSEAHPTYIGTYTDLTQADSTNPSDYTWNPIRDGDATRDGINETISVTTRGIRFNIPKTLTVGSTITLRYEEYPLGVVPIGNEPAGYFGGGNKQNLSAKVISTANGSSVVEVAGNVIDVGNKNLLTGTSEDIVVDDTANTGTQGWSYNVFNLTQQLKVGDKITVSAEAVLTGRGDLSTYEMCLYDADFSGPHSDSQRLTAGTRSSATLEVNNLNGTGDTVLLIYAGNISDTEGKKNVIHHLKLEPGTIATPYAAFVDGDTFTAQPDGTCALFSEHKALYY